MFWESVQAGFTVLLYWETYVAGLEYLAIWMIPLAGFALIAAKSESIGCLSVLLGPILQTAATAIYVLTLSGIILGFSEDAEWQFPWIIIYHIPWEFLKLVGLLLLASVAMAFIPILGRLHSLHTLILGGITLAFILKMSELLNPGMVLSRVSFVPELWFAIGLVVIGGILSWLGIILFGLAFGTIGLFFEEEGAIQTALQFLMYPLVGIFGMIPVFIYGAWLGAQLRGGF